MNTLDRYSSTIGLLIVVGTFAAAALAAGAGRLPESTVVQPTPALVYVLSTPVPTVPPTPDRELLNEVEALKIRVAQLEAQRNAPAPEPIYVQASAPQAAPTQPPAPPPTAEPGPTLQAIQQPAGEEPLTDAQLREAMDR